MTPKVLPFSGRERYRLIVLGPLVLSFLLGGGFAAAEEFFIAAPGGAQLRASFRPGRAPAIVLVHGRGIGSEGFAAWFERAFPGRALLAYDRRGYLPSTDPFGDPAINADDVYSAIDAAQARTGGAPVAVVGVSLGAMMIPPLDPARTAWVALLSPGSSGMLRYLHPAVQTYSLALLAGYPIWMPPARQSMIDLNSNLLTDGIIERLRAEGPAAEAMEEALSLRRRHARWRELILQETIWSLSSGNPGPRFPGIPVLVAAAAEDEVVPLAAVEELSAGLRAEGAAVSSLLLPGGHLTPLFRPELIEPAIAAIEAGR